VPLSWQGTFFIAILPAAMLRQAVGSLVKQIVKASLSFVT